MAGLGKRIGERARLPGCFDGRMDVRPCTEGDLELLRARWPTTDDVAGVHYDEQQGGGATFLVGWVAAEPWGLGLIQWRGCLGVNARTTFPRCVEVNHLQVRPHCQGRGTGSAILGAAERLTRDGGAAEIAVSVSLGNHGAARLYRRLGYQPTGILDDCRYRWRDDEGGWHDEVETSELLVKRL